MPSLTRARKGAAIASKPEFLRPLIKHRVAAAYEHIPAIRFCEANTLLDAGANKGQFSLAFRAVRPHSKIIAFEPLPEAADTFEKVFSQDEQCSIFRFALADSSHSAQFHIADRADSSSLLRPGQGQERAFGVRPTRTISVPVNRLDECVDLTALTGPILLKVDVQGGELAVFEGCKNLEAIDFIYVELSFVELYESQPLFNEVTSYLLARGFSTAGVYNQVSTAQFGPTQVDVLFKKVNP